VRYRTDASRSKSYSAVLDDQGTDTVINTFRWRLQVLSGSNVGAQPQATPATPHSSRAFDRYRSVLCSCGSIIDRWQLAARRKFLQELTQGSST
jgi:hypothetical protein